MLGSQGSLRGLSCAPTRHHPHVTIATRATSRPTDAGTSIPSTSGRDMPHGDAYQRGDFKRMVDPEVPLRRYGHHFGKTPLLAFLDAAPRVRTRVTEDRARDQLIDLAVMNTKLRGGNPTEARIKLEKLKSDRDTWDRVYETILANDVKVTIEEIEATARLVQETMEAQEGDTLAIQDVGEDLEQVMRRIETARATLNTTESRIAANVRKIQSLEAEARQLQESFATVGERGLNALVALSDDPRSIEFSTAGPATTTTTTTTTTSPVSSSSARAAFSPSRATATPNPISRAVKPSQRYDSPSDPGLYSDLELESSLKNHWMPIAFSADLQPGTLFPIELFEEPWVVFRGDDGVAGVLRDSCAHRACPLSLGKVEGNTVQCAYHGWEFGTDGMCTKMPSTRFCSGRGVQAMPTVEAGGFLWGWPGDAPPAEGNEPPVEAISPPKGYKVHAEICLEVPVDHGLLIENLLDLAHAPFTHQGTFAKGWPVPDAVKISMNRLLAGNWQPYPIKMSFEPPCMTLSTIGLARPGQPVFGAEADACDKHLHQLHVVLPAKRGHTRLLYRMSLDFMGFLQGFPGTDALWKAYADAVLGEDLTLVLGQQARMERGESTWRYPVSYDKMAVRYRRWRNEMAGRVRGSFSRQEEAQGEARAAMTAGEMFALEEEEPVPPERQVVVPEGKIPSEEDASLN